MFNLDFSVNGVEPILFAAEPQLAFRARLAQRPDTAKPICNVLLRCQIRIEPQKRAYPESTGGGTATALLELFGGRERWGQTMRSLLWTHVSHVVPAFDTETTIEIAVPCSFDFNLAATKYFSALDAGEIPLIFLFSGTVFYRETDKERESQLRVAPIPWDRECTFRLPLETWRVLRDHYYPNAAWLRLRQDIFSRLQQFKSERAFPTFEHALERLLDGAMDHE